MSPQPVHTRQFIPERLVPGLIFFIVAVSLWFGFNFASGEIGQAVVERTVLSIDRTLTVGSTGEDVAAWQEFLIAEDTGPAAGALKAALEGDASAGYFGSLTGAATEEWQAAQGITPTYPAVGPKTRSAI